VSPQQLASERRRGRVAGVAAVLAGVLFAVGLYWYQAAAADQPDENKADQLRYFHDHANDLLAATVLQGLGILLICIPAWHLYRAAKDRSPDQSPVVAVVGLLGPAAFAATLFLRSVALSVLAADFADSEFQTLSAAEDAFDSTAIRISEGLGIVGALALGFWFVKGSLDAMRLGLLGRFIGIIGIALGPALILGFGLFVMPLWLVALGAMFLGLRPGGVPPAWRSGRAEPWAPPGEALRPAAEEPAGGERNGDVEAIGPAVRKPADGERGPPV
jgi:hypothetical protein